VGVVLLASLVLVSYLIFSYTLDPKNLPYGGSTPEPEPTATVTPEPDCWMGSDGVLISCREGFELNGCPDVGEGAVWCRDNLLYTPTPISTVSPLRVSP